MNLQTVVDRYVQSRATAGCAPRSVDTVRRRLQRFVDTLKPGVTLSEVNEQTIEKFFGNLRDLGLASGTLAGYKSTLKAFYRWCMAEGVHPTNPADVLKTRRHSYSFEPVHSRAANPDDFITVLNSLDAYTADGHPRHWRDAALISLAADSSARLGEIHNLRRVDIEKALEHPLHTPAGHVYYRTASHGKTGHVTIRFYFHTGQFLANWIAAMPKEAVWLWTSVNNPRRMRIDYVHKICERICKFAGVPTFRFHAIRKRDVTDIIQTTGDAKFGQLYAGHKDIRTTQAYYNQIENDQVDGIAAELASKRRRGNQLADDFFKPREK